MDPVHSDVRSPDDDGNISDHDDCDKGRSTFEMEWTKSYEFLKASGYQLRPRYDPDWEPSWKKTGQRPQECEDYIRMPAWPNVIDATRIKDGKLVYIKRIPKASHEYQILRCLEDKDDETNHTVPVLECFKDDQNLQEAYMVMPFLLPANKPPFDTVKDITDIVKQLLEGLVFMHNKGVAHKNCAAKNIKMDGTSLYPKGFHPVSTSRTPDNREEANPLARSMAPTPVKYYFVNFGMSESVAVELVGPVTIGDDLETAAPELLRNGPYDPFKVDIYILGNFFKKHIFTRYSNVEFLAPLIESMTKSNPDERPAADGLYEMWKATVAALNLNGRAKLLSREQE